MLAAIFPIVDKMDSFPIPGARPLDILLQHLRRSVQAEKAIIIQPKHVTAGRWTCSLVENRARTTIAVALDGVRSGCAADVWMRTWKHTVRAAQRTRLDPEEVSPDVC